ncbi:DUF397 domain-containing protein [Spirillospora sp. NPDC048832]
MTAKTRAVRGFSCVAATFDDLLRRSKLCEEVKGAVDPEGASWRKSTRSSEQGDACVEVASVSCAVAFRDSKDPDGPKILVSRGDFRLLAEVVKGL